MDELVQFQKIVTETAKALWHESHPDQERLPKHFENRIRLCLRKIQEGSAIAPLEVYIDDRDQIDLYDKKLKEEPPEIKKAIALARETFRAVGSNEAIPDRLPRSLLPEYSKWGRQLQEGESIELIVKGKKPVRVTPPVQALLRAYLELPHEEPTEVTGTILEVDVRQGRFQVWMNEKAFATVNFKEEQEDIVINALKDRRRCKVRLRGRGEFSSAGKLLRINEITDICINPIEEPQASLYARPIEDMLSEVAREIPVEEWEKLPADLSDNIDHYLYGWPKK
ncbi:MAG: hypothetical protein MN733_30805 [Nitrososphaera sp.]|nr:hypothetical protein [Nitrososphaera sp.]